jgi:pyridinium-3,5-biscarboxylic acid mononucleotide synthase
MQSQQLLSILQAVSNHTMTTEEALSALRDLPYKDIDIAKIDHHRNIRTGVNEVIYGENKTPKQVIQILNSYLDQQEFVMITRANQKMMAKVKQSFPQAVNYKKARIIAIGKAPTISDDQSYVAVVTAGTTDIPVAEEAATTLELHGTKVCRIFDVGVAGLHRLLDKRQKLWDASAIIALAGMEGALATVIGGLVSVPVIAVPTSIGYGASFNGVAALLAMLNSCAPGVSVVNIDNGFGAAIFAHLIIRSKK